METVEKRVRLDAKTGKAVIDLLNPSPMWKIPPELILSDRANAMRTTPKNQLL